MTLQKIGMYEVYKAGHQVALERAAAGTGSEEELKQALGLNACASHYLSDMFSSGHVRTPRAALVAAAGAKTTSSMFALRSPSSQVEK